MAIVWTVISSANWAGILPPLTKLKSKETECTWMHLKVISSRHRDVIPESSVKSSSLDSSINYWYNIISHWSKQFRTIGCWSKQWTMAHWSKQFKKGTYWGKQFKTIARIGKCKFNKLPITVTNTGLPIVVQPVEANDNWLWLVEYKEFYRRRVNWDEYHWTDYLARNKQTV